MASEAPPEQSKEDEVDDSPKKKMGDAPIKKEYLATDHQRKLAVEFLPGDVAKEMTQKIESGNADKKFKGRNKQRPIFKAAHHNLCVMAARCFDDEKCSFGDKCRFSHDLAAYMKEREEDIGNKCHCFETFGRCRFGILCRYGKSHIKEDGTNVVDEEKFMQQKDKTASSNELTKELQTSLRKHKVKFPRTDEFTMKRAEATETVKSEVDKSCEQQGDKDEVSKSYDKTKELGESPRKRNAEFSETEEFTVKREKLAEANKSCVEMPTPVDNNASVVVEERRLGIECDSFSDSRRENVSEALRKPFLSPLTTVGNLPFRRICTEFGAQVTCGEMAMANQLLQGSASEWALLRRHHSEPFFGVQLCGGNPAMMARCAELITDRLNVDFIDINAACPIALVCKKGEGASLMARPQRLVNVAKAVRSVSNLPLSVKIRTGMGDVDSRRTAHEVVPTLADAGVDFVAIHGRTRDQRYTRLADWDYLDRCAKVGLENSISVFGVGDTLSYTDYYGHLENTSVENVLVARGALIKPWIFTEIEEKRHWDISSSERFDMLRRFANYGLEHWGSDTKGVETTRRFLLEWQSFLYRYIPVGLLEVLPQRINERPPSYYGRDDLETLMASPNCADWIKISQMLLGPVPEHFSFLPKHKANAYQ